MTAQNNILNHFGLSRIPFSVLPQDPPWLDAPRQLVMDRLKSTLPTGGFSVIHGKTGCGKTRIAHAFCHTLNPNHHHPVNITHATLNQSGMLQAIAWNLGIEPAHSRPRNIHNITRHLLESPSTPLFVFDELQSCEYSTLEEIRLLCEIDIGASRRIPVILIGTDDFLAALNMRRVQSLTQRISQYLELRPIDADAVPTYIRHHLQCAKCNADLLSANALTRIAQLTGGIPRLINNLTRTALEFAASASDPLIELRHIDDAAALVFSPNTRTEQPS